MQSARKTGVRIWRRIYGTNFWCQFPEPVTEALAFLYGQSLGLKFTVC